jgi:hypothetical protein
VTIYPRNMSAWMARKSAGQLSSDLHSGSPKPKTNGTVGGKLLVSTINTVFDYDLLCDLLEMLNLINIESTVATRRNLVDPIQRTNMRGLMSERFRAFDLRTEGCRLESRWTLFFILFFSIYFLFFICNFFRHIFQYYPLSFLQLIFFKFQNRPSSVFSSWNVTGTKSTYKCYVPMPSTSWSLSQTGLFKLLFKLAHFRTRFCTVALAVAVKKKLTLSKYMWCLHYTCWH